MAADTATCARYEAKGVVARLHVLPEVHIRVVKDVGVEIQVVEALGGQHHAHIITCRSAIMTGHHLAVPHHLAESSSYYTGREKRARRSKTAQVIAIDEKEA